MATAKKNLTGNEVQGHQVHPLDKMIAIAVRIAAREGLLFEDRESKIGTTETGHEPAEDTRGKGRRTA